MPAFILLATPEVLAMIGAGIVAVYVAGLKAGRNRSGNGQEEG
jgi:hypothetical protein